MAAESGGRLQFFESAGRSEQPKVRHKRLVDFLAPEILASAGLAALLPVGTKVPARSARETPRQGANCLEVVPEEPPKKRKRLYPARFLTVPVDLLGTYSRLRRDSIQIPKLDAGIWSELDPAHFDEEVGCGDGDVRAYLEQSGVNREDWEDLDPPLRVRLRNALRKLAVIERAVAYAFDSLDPIVAKRAVAFLEMLGERIDETAGANSGFLKSVEPRIRFALARESLQFVEEVLTVTKKHFGRTLRSERRFIEPLRDEIAQVLCGRFGRRAVGLITADDLQGLAAQTPRDLAKTITRRLDPSISADLLDRATPRHRNR